MSSFPSKNYRWSKQPINEIIGRPTLADTTANMYYTICTIYISVFKNPSTCPTWLCLRNDISLRDALKNNKDFSKKKILTDK